MRNALVKAIGPLRRLAPQAYAAVQIAPFPAIRRVLAQQFSTSQPVVFPEYAERKSPVPSDDAISPPEPYPLPSSSYPPPPPIRTRLSSRDKPLVWIDCEMTGLDPLNDSVLEIAVIVTDGNLEPTDNGLSYTILTEPDELEKMDEWCRKTHGENGLIAACQDPFRSVTLAQAEVGVRKYIEDRIEKPKTANLAGSTVHFDLRFMMRYFPSVVDYLHYRIVDVSSIFEVCRRWFPKQLWEWSQRDRARWSDPKLSQLHRASSDIRFSIRQLEWYRRAILTGLPTTATSQSPSETSAN